MDRSVPAPAAKLLKFISSIEAPSEPFIEISDRVIDLSGMMFGKLTVLGPVGKRHDGVLWLARCECGGAIVAPGHNLRKCISCGCEKIKRAKTLVTVKHGHLAGGKPSRTYNSYNGMMQRCYDPNSDNYPWYGAIGVTVCERWRGNFAAFLEDMGERPAGKTLDRSDPYGNYEPDNCEWQTAEHQARNRRKRMA